MSISPWLIFMYIFVFFLVSMGFYLLYAWYNVPLRTSVWEAYGSDMPSCWHLHIVGAIHTLINMVWSRPNNFEGIVALSQQQSQIEDTGDVIRMPNTFNRLRISSFLIPLTWLIDYRKTCKIDADTFEYIPPLFPSALCFVPTYVLFLRKHFGLSLTNLNLVRLRFSAHVDLNQLLHEELMLEAYVSRYRNTEHGIEVDIVNEVIDTKDLVLWSSELTYRCVESSSQRSGAQQEAAEEDDSNENDTSDCDSEPTELTDSGDGDQAVATRTERKFMLDERLFAEGDVGYKYAASSGDVRPSHLFSWSARLVGLERPVAHPAWLLAAVLEIVRQKGRVPVAPYSVDCEFKSSLGIPGETRVQCWAEGDKTVMSASDPRSSVPHLKATIIKS